MKPTPWLVLLLASSLVSGCTTAPAPTPLTDDSTGDSDPPTSADAPPPSTPAPRPEETSDIIATHTFPGHLGFAWCPYVCLGSPVDVATFRVTFPSNYSEAVLEMVWDAAYVTNEKLDLMVHTPGAAGGPGMVGEAAGPSPIRLVVDDLKPGSYDLIGYLPLDSLLPVVNQDFTIYATFFDGPAPEDYTAHEA